MAASSTAISERPITLSREVARATPEAAELVVHVLAQLPDAVVAELPADLPDRAALELLARAYGIRERVIFGWACDGGRLDTMLADRVSLAELMEALSDDDDAPAPIRDDDEVLDDHRVGVVTNVPAHYRVPLLNAIAKRLRAVDCTFHVFFCARSDESRPWLAASEGFQFEHEFLRSLEIPRRARPPLVPLGLEAALSAYRPTIVLSTGFSPAVSGRVARHARRSKIPFGIWSGEHESMRTARSRVRRSQRRRLLANAGFAIAYGAGSARYLRRLAPALPTVIGRNTAPFVPPVAVDRASTPPIELVAIGDLADSRKGIDVAIDALKARPELECRLRVIGGGARLSELRSRAGDDPRIRLVGPCEPDETRLVLSTANVFLFPTRSDIFGLALVEAMGAGLCTLVSPSAGAVEDLCVHRRNSLVLPSHDPKRWADAIAEVVSDQGLRQTLGERARTTVSNRWTIDHAADAMIAGLRLAALVTA
jgi:glycosyltransferase involved in cell wall biosynthesis